MMSVIPAGFAVLTAIVTCFYPINHKVEKELEEAMTKLNASEAKDAEVDKGCIG
jgi:Na+/melibiose symporter-like transporter